MSTNGDEAERAEKVRRELFEGLSKRERAALWVLWSVRGVRHSHLARLLSDWDVEMFVRRSVDELESKLQEAGLSPACRRRAAEQFDRPSPLEAFERERDALPDDGRIVMIGDDAYPRRLFALDDPPTFLYVRGEFEACNERRTLAVVGSRRVDVRDARRARGIVERLVRAGLVIVSGGAIGVDTVSHKATLAEGGRTVAVLPGGLNHPTPKRNRKLYEDVARSGGAVVTEYPLGVSARKYHFPRRNRLIAALGDATFVVRAGVDSGTMLTVKAARDINRPLCALAGGLDEPLAQGCLALIVEGAQAVRDADDILGTLFEEVLASEPEQGDRTVDDEESEAPSSPVPEGLSEEAKLLLKEGRQLASEKGNRTLHIDTLRHTLDEEAADIQTALLELELRGLIGKAPGAQAYTFRA